MRAVISCLLLLLSSGIYAQVSSDGINLAYNNRSQVGGGLALSKIEYEVDDFEFDIERTILHGEFAQDFGVVDGFGYLGLVVDGAINRDGSDLGGGKGFLLGGGVRGRAHTSGLMKINWLTTLSYDSESFEEDDTEVEISALELQVAGVFQYLVSKGINIYGGLHLFPFTDAEYKVKAPGSYHDDMKRSSMLGISAGANFMFGTAYLRPEIMFIGQQTISFNAGTVL